MTSRTKALNHFRKVDILFFEATLPYHASLPTRLAEKTSKQALFRALISIVVSQQLATVAASTIFSRVKKICNGKLTAEFLDKIKTEKLVSAGLSKSKIRTIKGIARAVQSGDLDLIKLRGKSREEVSAKLTTLWGLGPWSVDMFMMFSLGYTDIFSPGDLGLVRAMETIFSLSKGTSHEELIAIAETWSPYRTYACLLLWRSRDAS